MVSTVGDKLSVSIPIPLRNVIIATAFKDHCTSEGVCLVFKLLYRGGPVENGCSPGVARDFGRTLLLSYIARC